jgi:hypothetical protein
MHFCGFEIAATAPMPETIALMDQRPTMQTIKPDHAGGADQWEDGAVL